MPVWSLIGAKFATVVAKLAAVEVSIRSVMNGMGGLFDKMPITDQILFSVLLFISIDILFIREDYNQLYSNGSPLDTRKPNDNGYDPDY